MGRQRRTDRLAAGEAANLGLAILANLGASSTTSAFAGC